MNNVLSAGNAVAAGIHPFKNHYTPGAFAAFAVVAVSIVLVWAMLNRVTSYNDNDEMFQRQNMGYTLVRGLQVVGLCYALAPVISYSTNHWWQQALWAAVDVVWVVLALFLVSEVIVWLVNRTHGGIDVIRNRSAHVGLVTGMFYLAFGLVLGATLPGPSTLGLGETFLVSSVFGLLGMAFIAGVYVALSQIRFFRYSRNSETVQSSDVRYNLTNYIMDRDWAATILAATLVWAFGVVTSSAIAGDFNGWANGIVTFIVAALIMVALTIGTMWLVDRFIITQETTKSMIEKGLIHPALVMAFILGGMAICVSYVVS